MRANTESAGESVVVLMVMVHLQVRSQGRRVMSPECVCPKPLQIVDLLSIHDPDLRTIKQLITVHWKWIL